MNYITRYFFILLFTFTSSFSMHRAYKIYAYFLGKDPVTKNQSLPVEVINIIREMSPFDWRAFSVTSKQFYTLSEEYRQKAIKKKAKYEAFKFIKNPTFFPDTFDFSFSNPPDFVATKLQEFYKNQYAYFIFFYGYTEWIFNESTNITLAGALHAKGKIYVIPQSWYFCNGNKYHGIELLTTGDPYFLSLINEQNTDQRYTIIIFPGISQIKLQKTLTHIKNSENTIMNFIDYTLFDTSEKIDNIINLIKESNYHGIISVPHNFHTDTVRDILWAACVGKIPMKTEQFQFFLNQRSTPTKFRRPGDQYNLLHILLDLSLDHPYLTEFTKSLVDYGINPNTLTNTKKTALHLLVESQQQKQSKLGTMELLLKNKNHPANPHIKDNKGKTPLDYYLEWTFLKQEDGHVEMENLLMQYMAPDHTSVKKMIKERSKNKECMIL